MLAELTDINRQIYVDLTGAEFIAQLDAVRQVSNFLNPKYTAESSTI